jgi:SWI/SNF-related matrix-associated actin-dependent regulator of chromatin subfamily A member 5
MKAAQCSQRSPVYSHYYTACCSASVYLHYITTLQIKNELSNISQVVRRIRCQGKLLLTGTPLQNNLHELWAMLNYLLPSTFTSSEPFDAAYDINACTTDETLLGQAHYALRPFTLRRLKSEVETSLPPRGVVEVNVPLSEAQHFWYKQLLQKDGDALARMEGAAAATAAAAASEAGGGSVDGTVLAPQSTDWKRLQSLMMQLRKCCNHPYLFPGADPNPGELDEGLVQASGKMMLLDRLLPKLKAGGHRVCLFSQFTQTLDILEDYCNLRRYKYRRLDGSVSRVRRAISISEFQKEGSKLFVFLMTTRAGGLGITLTAADTVILFDSDWNPQVCAQHTTCIYIVM